MIANERETNHKVISITGASSGIGEAIAMRLGRAGARLVLAARRSERLAAASAFETLCQPAMGRCRPEMRTG